MHIYLCVLYLYNRLMKFPSHFVLSVALNSNPSLLKLFSHIDNPCAGKAKDGYNGEFEIPGVLEIHQRSCHFGGCIWY